MKYTTLCTSMMPLLYPKTCLTTRSAMKISILKGLVVKYIVVITQATLKLGEFVSIFEVQRTDLELMQETIVCELDVSGKKVFCITVYRSPSQNSEQYDNFINKVQIMVNRLQMERPHLVILTGDFNCITSLWWTDDAESPEGMALNEISEGNNLYQLIDEPTNIRGTNMSCVDLIITDQPNLFVESGVHPSLDDN